MKWSELSRTQRALAITGGVVLGLAVVAGAFALGLGLGDGPEAATDTTTDAAETTGTAEATSTEEPATETVEPETPPAAEPELEPPAPAPAPEPDDARVFGRIEGIRDESGGAWAALWVDIDTAVFLTDDAALDWLTSQGDAEFYNADYWYAKPDGAAITSHRLKPSSVKVWMYTYPTTPPIGFYGPGMAKQTVGFGEFYDAIYMAGDPDGLLDRYYWFTVDGDYITIIEEQPRDAYYEP
ncbi:MAG TPA: hypothetical protein ENN10_05265 [Actinobacteria bacterium]|nr:hypothetical protein [Actinomycetota bacterium]